MPSRDLSPRRGVTAAARRTAAAAAAFAASAVSAQPASPTLFVINNDSAEVSVFEVRGDGQLESVGTFATDDGPQAAALTPSGDYLAVGHGTLSDTVESLIIFQVHADGSLSHVLQTTVPDSPLDMVWISDGILAVSKSTFGGTNQVRTYAFDADADTFTFIDAANAGVFHSSLEWLPCTGVLYAQDSSGYTIRRFSVSPTGDLDLLGSLDTSPTYPLDLLASPDASVLYAAGGVSNGSDKIHGFDIEPTSGALTPLPGSPFLSPGDSPADLALTQDDGVLVVGHGADATVRTFLIEDDGSLAVGPAFFDIGLPGSIGDVQALDDLVFITDESALLDGVSGVYVFQSTPDGQLTQVGPVYDTGGVRPERMVVWSGKPMPCPGEPGDFDDDGAVGISDLLILLGAWGRCDSPGACPEDLDDDGTVGVSDLLELLTLWG